jgi:glutamine amidotransferase
MVEGSATDIDISRPEKPRVRLLDYGAGNLRSVHRALEAAGATVEIAGSVGGDRILLPGVGAFGEARRRLAAHWDDLLAWTRADKPLLGICLGMQLLFERSYEHGEHEGLGIFKGEVAPLPDDVTVPHMGWQQLSGLGDPAVYFAHSFGVRAPTTGGTPDVIATVEHGARFVAAARRGNVWGYQFHPEKSGPAGIDLLRRWLTVGGR